MSCFGPLRRLEETSARSVEERSADRADSRTKPGSDRMQRGYANLQATLADAQTFTVALGRDLIGRDDLRR
jgi:hypothetical protein